MQGTNPEPSKWTQKFVEDKGKLEAILSMKDAYFEKTDSGPVDQLRTVYDTLSELKQILDNWEKYYDMGYLFMEPKNFYRNLQEKFSSRISGEIQNIEKQIYIANYALNKNHLNLELAKANLGEAQKIAYAIGSEKYLENINRLNKRIDKINLDSELKQTSNIISFTPKKTDKKPDFEPVLEDFVEPKIEKEETTQLNSVSFDALLNYYKSTGIVGEEKNCILMTLSALNGIHFGIVGDSGSGKTKLMGSLIDLLPKNFVYELQLASDQALFNDRENINGKKFIYIPEIQKPFKRKDTPILEIVKTLSENKDVNRKVTLKQGEIIEYRINNGPTLIFTLAFENDFKPDIELSRRFVMLYTDTSKEHIEMVLNENAKSRTEPQRMDVENKKLLSNYIKNCIENKDISFIDVFAEGLTKYVPHLPKTVGYINHYYKLLDACAKFHNVSRIKENRNIFLDLEDHFLIYNLYHEDFQKAIKQLSGNQITSVPEINWEELYDNGSQLMHSKYPHLFDDWDLHQKDFLSKTSEQNIFFGDKNG